MSNGWEKFGDAITRLESVMKDPKNVALAGNFALGAAKLLCSGFRVSSGELRNSLSMTVTENTDGITAHVGTNKEYATYVEFGTGPKGAAKHEGVSPDVDVVYTLTPWWIHESQVDPAAAQVYNWFHIDTPQGRFYKVTGQPAHPYIYPAFNDNQKEIMDILAEGFKEAIE